MKIFFKICTIYFLSSSALLGQHETTQNDMHHSKNLNTLMIIEFSDESYDRAPDILDIKKEIRKNKIGIIVGGVEMLFAGYLFHRSANLNTNGQETFTPALLNAGGISFAIGGIGVTLISAIRLKRAKEKLRWMEQINVTPQSIGLKATF